MNLSDILTNWQEYLKIVVGLLAMSTPPAVAALFLTLTRNFSPTKKNRVAGISCVSYLLIVTVLSFTGTAVLNLFDISVSGFQIAGGILLLLTGLDMMRKPSSSEDALPVDTSGSLFSLSLVPLTIPVLAGPATMSTVVVFAGEHAGLVHQVGVAISGGITALILYTVLRTASFCSRWLTPTVNQVVEKLMGLILVAIAVEFILHGFAEHFPAIDIHRH